MTREQKRTYLALKGWQLDTMFGAASLTKDGNCLVMTHPTIWLFTIEEAYAYEMGTLAEETAWTAWL
jgi:hypothetical protein